MSKPEVTYADEVMAAIERCEAMAFTLRASFFHAYINDGNWIPSSHVDNFMYYRQVSHERRIQFNLKHNTVRDGLSSHENGVQYLYSLILSDGELPFISVEQAKKKKLIKHPYQWASLSKRERQWHDNIPPEREVLEKFMRYHAPSSLLIHVNDGVAEYEAAFFSPPQNFICVDGTYYARWRLISQLLYGNPHGVPNIEESQELLDKIPVVNYSLNKELKAALKETEQEVVYYEQLADVKAAMLMTRDQIDKMLVKKEKEEKATERATERAAREAKNFTYRRRMLLRRETQQLLSKKDEDR